MADDIITAFPPYYDEVPMSRGTAGWENPPYYLTAYGLAVKHGYTGTEEEWLASLKGDPGPGIVILGHYDTLAELEEAVTEPEDGDMYDVGSGVSQLVYYWTSAEDDWLPMNVHGPQGETGPAGADGAPGVDGADGASAYAQAVEAGYTGTEQEFMALLADLPGYTEQARMWAVAAGSEATAAEGYAEAASASAAAAQQDVSSRVPKTTEVNGHALSGDITVEAEDIPYDNTDSGLTATDIQAAIDELAEGGGGGGGGSADDVTYDNTTSGLTATNVQDAIDEVVGDIPSVPAAYTSNPAMDGTASAGSSGSWAKGDHVHPSDTSRVPTTREVNGKALSADITLDKTDIGLGNVANVLQYSASNKPTAADVTYDGTTSGLSADDVQEAIDELAAEKQDAIVGGTITLSLSWSGNGPYTQTVTILGPTVTGNSVISLLPTASQLAQLITDGVTALAVENDDGVLTAYALGAAPSTAMAIECTVTEGRWID